MLFARNKKEAIRQIIVFFVILPLIIIIAYKWKYRGKNIKIVEGICQLEEKTKKWVIVNGTLVKGLTDEQREECSERKVRVSGYLQNSECKSGEECFSGDVIQVETIEWLD